MVNIPIELWICSYFSMSQNKISEQIQLKARMVSFGSISDCLSPMWQGKCGRAVHHTWMCGTEVVHQKDQKVLSKAETRAFKALPYSDVHLPASSYHILVSNTSKLSYYQFKNKCSKYEFMGNITILCQKCQPRVVL